MEQQNSFFKILNVVKTVLIWIVFAIAACMMVFTLVSVNMFDQNERSVFGYKFFVVQSDSMAATDFGIGDIIISKEVPLKDLKEGDIITFISQSSYNYGETVTHKIRKVTTDDAGEIAFVTYGTTTNADDEALATMVLGQYTGKIEGLGTFFMFLKTTPGYIVCILIPFLILIISQGINCIRLFRRYKQEQMSEMQEEREKLAQEREESQKMMAELLALKAQLEKKEESLAATEEPKPVAEPPAEAPAAAQEPQAQTQETASAPSEAEEKTPEQEQNGDAQ